MDRRFIAVAAFVAVAVLRTVSPLSEAEYLCQSPKGVDKNCLEELVGGGCRDIAAGVIKVKVARDVRVAQVVADHGDQTTRVQRSFDPPFSEEEGQVGIDRWYTVPVRVGQERTKVRDYRFDQRVEYAQTQGTCPTELG